MLTSIRIQNFRSIRDASVKLGQVNLFIGPNNSGKSNFLKGISLLTARIRNYGWRGAEEKRKFFESNIFRKALLKEEDKWIGFNVVDNGPEGRKANAIIKILPIASQNLFDSENDKETTTKFDIATSDGSVDDFTAFQVDVAHIIIHKINPDAFSPGKSNGNETRLSENGSNIVSYLFYLSQNHRPLFRQLEADLTNCVGEFTSVATPADPDEPSQLRLRFFDKNDVGYWAEEVSEGVLYFLALLCIVHQPDPPKLLLLEEPEKGIHPRRIKEVMDFIFELAELRGIQIILTSHSPYVVDHFADIPECISVFDRENDETVIRNAGDLISESNAQLAAEGKPPIRYTDSLGEHWVSGFLGGVPA